MSTGVSDRKERNSSIELLRIVSMLMIVFCHFATHGGFEFAPSELTLPRFWWNAIEAGGNLGTDVFVLISGYFLICDRRPYPDLRHVLKFWGQVFFYSTVIFAVFCLTGLAGFSAKGLVKALFPVSFGTWWFASAYFVLYLIHPFLNKLLAACDRRGFQFILLFLLTLWCVIPTFTTSYYQSNSLVWFVTLYAVGGFIRRFGLFEGSKPLQWLAAFLAVSLVRYLSAVVLILIGTRFPFAGENSLFFYGVQSVPTFLSAVTLFMTFEKIKMRGAGLINLAASASFGVYLIHDNPYVRRSSKTAAVSRRRSSFLIRSASVCSYTPRRRLPTCSGSRQPKGCSCLPRTG